MSDLPWIKWDGGECPVNGDHFVIIKTRYGRIDLEPKKASEVNWFGYGDGANDVVAYSLCTEDGTPIAPDSPEQGRKHDTGKPRYDLMPVHAEAEMVDVLTFGAGKYGAENWRKVKKERYIAASGRHRAAYRMGQTCDPETGKHHLAHAMCCDAFVIELDLQESENDHAN